MLASPIESTLKVDAIITGLCGARAGAPVRATQYLLDQVDQANLSLREILNNDARIPQVAIARMERDAVSSDIRNRPLGDMRN